MLESQTICSPSNRHEFRAAEFLFPGYPICDHANHVGFLQRATQVQGIQAFPKQIEGKKWSIAFHDRHPNYAQSGSGSAETLDWCWKCQELLPSVPGKSMPKSSIPNQPTSTSRRGYHEAEYCIIVSLIRCVVLSKRPLR